MYMETMRTMRMKRIAVGVVWALLALAVKVPAQATKQARAAAAAKQAAYYYDPIALNLVVLVPAPPAVDSAANKAELAELHRIEQARTPEQVAAAKRDEDEEDVFAFKTVLGADFNPEALPLTAALGEHVKNEQSVAGAQLKVVFPRVRPYNADKTLHPVCAVTDAVNSYPSGHALTGYLEAFTLVEMAPEKRAAILERADEYAHNRLVCGVHYPSDIEESRRVALLVFGNMMATPKFRQDLAAAKLEMRTKLGFSTNVIRGELR
jgi:acid phosphatase (class A)